jgi:ribosomal-protein-alanine N-acetyltransferase
MKTAINSERFHIRSLEPDFDDFKGYLSWMRDVDANPFISGIDPTMTMNELISYVLSKNYSETACLMGIFQRTNHLHVGNIKLEPLHMKSHAWLGILIGEKSMRGKGAGFEVIKSVTEYFQEQHQITRFYLGVDEKNVKAVSLYKKIGFRVTSQSNSVKNGIEMVLDLT